MPSANGSDLAARLAEILAALREERHAWEDVARRVGDIESVSREIHTLRRHIDDIDAILDEILTRLDALGV
jgi:hypothetical protein